ncbi:hypothetical protein N2152v2_007866 [Parachlorella kessleri]
MRHVCFQLARKYGAAYLQLHVSCSTEQAIEWNKGRPPAQQVPDNVIRSTAAMFEDPSSSPFRWESKTLVVDANSCWYNKGRPDGPLMRVCCTSWTLPAGGKSRSAYARLGRFCLEGSSVLRSQSD